VTQRRHVRYARDHRLADRPGAFCCSDARVAASTCQEFVTRKLGELTRASVAEQNAEHQGLQRDLAPGSRPANRGPPRHRHRQGCHQKIQQPRDMVMVAVTATTLRPRFRSHERAVVRPRPRVFARDSRTASLVAFRALSWRLYVVRFDPRNARLRVSRRRSALTPFSRDRSRLLISKRFFQLDGRASRASIRATTSLEANATRGAATVALFELAKRSSVAEIA